MLSVFRDRARLFVTIGWVLFLVSIPICLSIGATAAINNFYFPVHQKAPFDAFDMKAARFVLACSAFAAVASSVALALKFRAAASVLVAVIWSAAIFGTAGARLFVKPGPESIERHVGQQLYSVPRQYVLVGFGGSADESPHQLGFRARLCLPDLKVSDHACRRDTQLSVVPKDVDALDISLWRRFQSDMESGADRSGYKSYVHTLASKSGGPAQISHYFVRQDSEGHLTRLVVCRSSGEAFCSHHASMANYWLSYQAPLSDGDTLDGKLSALVESWRRD